MSASISTISYKATRDGKTVFQDEEETSINASVHRREHEQSLKEWSNNNLKLRDILVKESEKSKAPKQGWKCSHITFWEESQVDKVGGEGLGQQACGILGSQVWKPYQWHRRQMILLGDNLGMLVPQLK